MINEKYLLFKDRINFFQAVALCIYSYKLNVMIFFKRKMSNFA